jgi:competence protein ComEC
MPEIINVSPRMSDGQKGFWSVDHILHGRDMNLFVGSKEFAGYFVRLVKYKEDMNEPIGIKHMLVEEGPLSEKLSHGNTYLFTKKSTEIETEANFNGWLSPIRRLIEPVETIREINERLNSTIRSLLSGTDVNAESSIIEDIRPVSFDKDGLPIWAKIHVHHVGQGDTIVLELPGNQLWMIDAYFKTTEHRNRFDEWMEVSFPERELNRLIISHFHYDHIHSIPYVIAQHVPKEVTISDSLIHKTSSTQRTLHHAAGKLHILKNEETRALSDLTVSLYRTDKISNVMGSLDPNVHEIIITLQTKHSFAILAGDTPGSVCNQLLEQKFPNLDINTNVRFFKVSHHGSKTGYDDSLIAHLNPNESIISCGKVNRYGHPHIPSWDKLKPRPTVTWKDGKNVYSYLIR